VVDDRALFFRPDWERIAEEIEFNLGLHLVSIDAAADPTGSRQYETIR
jgi:hypothetical protein